MKTFYNIVQYQIFTFLDIPTNAMVIKKLTDLA